VVAGRRLAPGVGDGNRGPGEVSVIEAHSPIEGTRIGAREALQKASAAPLLTSAPQLSLSSLRSRS
jgi:hypothetical protein